MRSRSRTWSVVPVAAFLYLAPTFGVLDPRNLLVVLDHSVFEQWGTVTSMPVGDIGPAGAWLGLAAYGIVLAGLTFLLPLRRWRYPD